MKKTLRFWILTLIVFTMIGIITSMLFSSYIVTKNKLIENTLEQNEVYSLKLAQMSDEVFSSMYVNLEARKADVIKHLNDKTELTSILDQLLVSSKNFNSLSVIGNDGVAIATSPNVGIAGNKIESEGVRQALLKKENFISRPYQAITGRLLILVSTPLFNEYDRYLGMLNGTIYLQEDNFIQNILSEHYSQDGSYVYVVDKEGTLLYHPDKNRIGENVKNNLVVQQLIEGKSGAQQVTNTQDKQYLAGYTFIEKSEWGVVSQTPYNSSLRPLIGIMMKMSLYSLPFVLLFFVLAYMLSTKLAAPLKKLAMYTLNQENDATNDKVHELHIPTWYFEAKQLTDTIEGYRKRQQDKVDNFKSQSFTDALTGLKNRRYAEQLFSNLLETKRTFSMIMLDIDFFKKVNDEFGHLVGDEVLQFLSSKMESVVKEQGVCIRLGGEEFAIILPNTKVNKAYEIAENLRKDIENSIPPTKKKLTISAGVGEHSNWDEMITDFTHRIDLALYEAKSNGRNQTVIAKP